MPKHSSDRNNSGRTEQELSQLFRPPHPARKGREIPIQTLYQRLGLKPYERKADFVETNWQPSVVSLPLNTHIGRPATPTVQVGDPVRRGDVIADVPPSELGCPVHASISGTCHQITATCIQLTA